MIPVVLKGLCNLQLDGVFHMGQDWVGGDHAIFDVDSEFRRNLDDDFADALFHRAGEYPVAIFRNPHNVVTMVVNRMLAARVGFHGQRC